MLGVLALGLLSAPVASASDTFVFDPGLIDSFCGVVEAERAGGTGQVAFAPRKPVPPTPVEAKA